MDGTRGFLFVLVPFFLTTWIHVSDSNHRSSIPGAERIHFDAKFSDGLKALKVVELSYPE